MMMMLITLVIKFFAIEVGKAIVVKKYDATVIYDYSTWTQAIDNFCSKWHVYLFLTSDHSHILVKFLACLRNR